MQTKYMRDFSGEYTLLVDSQDIRSVAEYAGIESVISEDFTGCVVSGVETGEYSEIWFTESSAPWNLNAIYRQVSQSEIIS